MPFPVFSKRKYLWYLRLEVSFSVTPPPPEIYKLPPLPKAVNLHHDRPLWFYAPPPRGYYCTVPKSTFAHVPVCVVRSKLNRTFVDRYSN